MMEEDLFSNGFRSIYSILCTSPKLIGYKLIYKLVVTHMTGDGSYLNIICKIFENKEILLMFLILLLMNHPGQTNGLRQSWEPNGETSGKRNFSVG